jgi:hypothetical protein
MEATNINPITKRILRGKKIKAGKCVFPFKYKNKLHYSCIQDNDKRFWCGTSVNPKTNQWLTYGFCEKQEETPKPSTPQISQPSTPQISQPKQIEQQLSNKDNEQDGLLPLPPQPQPDYKLKDFSITDDDIQKQRSLILKINDCADFNKSYILIDGILLTKTKFQIINISNIDIPGSVLLGHFKMGNTLEFKIIGENYYVSNNNVIYFGEYQETLAEYENLKKKYSDFYTDIAKNQTLPILNIKNLTAVTQRNIYIVYDDIEKIQSILFRLENETDYKINIIKQEKELYSTYLFKFYNHEFYTDNKDDMFMVSDNIGATINAAVYDDVYTRKDLELIIADLTNMDDKSETNIVDYIKNVDDNFISISNDANVVKVHSEIFRAINGISSSMFKTTNSLVNIIDRFSYKIKQPTTNLAMTFFNMRTPQTNIVLKTIFASNLKDDGLSNNHIYSISQEDVISDRITSYKVLLKKSSIPNRNILSAYYEKHNYTISALIMNSINPANNQFIRPNSDITKILQHNYPQYNINNIYNFMEQNRDIAKSTILLNLLSQTGNHSQETMSNYMRNLRSVDFYNLPLEYIFSESEKNIIVPNFNQPVQLGFQQYYQNMFKDQQISLRYAPNDIKHNTIVSIILSNIIRPELENALFDFSEPSLFKVIEINTETQMAHVRPIYFGVTPTKQNYIQFKSQRLLIPLSCCFIVNHPNKALPHSKLDKSDKIDSFLFHFKGKTKNSIWMKLDNDAYYLMNEQPYLTNIEDKYYYTGIDEEHLYIIYESSGKWKLKIDNNLPTTIITSNGSINDLLNNQNVIIHPIKTTEFNTIRNAFSLISIIRGILPENPVNMNEVTIKNYITHMTNVLLDLFYDEYIIQLVFNKLPLLSHIQKYENTEKWRKEYIQHRMRLNNTNYSIQVYSLLQKQMIELAIIRNITYIHDTGCLEGNMIGCKNLVDNNLSELKESLPSNARLQKVMNDIRMYGSTTEIVRDILSDDYKHLESIVETFLQKNKTRFFRDGAMTDIITSTDQDECKGYKRNTVTNTIHRNMDQLVTFLVNETQIQSLLISQWSKPNREFKHPRDLFKDKYYQYQLPKSPSILGEVKTRLDMNVYKKINNQSFMNTLKYLYYVMRAGIYVSIRNNTLEHFIPFVNTKYHNDWSYLMNTLLSDYNGKVGVSGKVDKDTYYGTKSHFIQQKVQGFRKEKIMTDPKRWYVNGCLIGNEMPRNFWGDGMIPELIHMLKTLCVERRIPDVDFFINKKDFPQLKKNLTHPSHHIFDDYNKELRSHKYKNYTPILGFNTTDDHLDIPIPNMDDWRRETKIYYSYQCAGHTNIEKLVKWEDKQPTAFFRGGATGCSTDIQNNQRMKLAYISDTWKSDQTKSDLLDAGISKWAIRDKKRMGDPMRFVQPKMNNDFDKPWSVPLKLANYVPMDKQLTYKYVVYVDGNAAAYRYQSLMSMGSVILKVDSAEGFKLWFYNELNGYDITSDKEITNEDHIIVNANLDNLENVLLWCRENDDKCKIIAENCLRKVNTLFNYNSMLDYLQSIMVGINSNMVPDSRKKSTMIMNPKTLQQAPVPELDREQNKEDERKEDQQQDKDKDKPIEKKKGKKVKRTYISNIVNEDDIKVLKSFFVRRN